jgi:transcriptional/translational regulatory protein YebC/TACO1
MHFPFSDSAQNLDEEHLEKFKRFLSLLEEYDDFEAIYHNANLPEDDEDEE